MVLLVILLAVLVVRTVGVGEGWRGTEAKGESTNDTVGTSAVGSMKLVGRSLETNSMNMLEACDCCEPSSIWAQVWRPAPAISQTSASERSKIHTSEASKVPEIHTSEGRDILPSKGELIDINRADSAELEALPGIGPVLSVRIIKYRHLLGYYHEIDQLNDVYGLDSSVIEMNRQRFKCDSTLVRKININTATYRDLLRHPYINRSQVEAIIAYRRLSGSFNDISELTSNRIFTPDELIRLRPYLELK